MFWQKYQKLPIHSMWTNDLVTTIPDSQVLSRKDMFSRFSKIKPNLSYHSLDWIIAEAKRNHMLYQVGRDAYSRTEDTRKKYKAEYSKTSKRLLKKMAEEYPDLKYTVFETFLLNEFANHMIAQNTVVIQIEKELCQFTFEYLNSQFPGKVLFAPKPDDILRYRTPDCIIIENLISESPEDDESPHAITIEKFLVDCVCDKIIPELFASSEIKNIYEIASERYKIDMNKLKRYANRRSAWQKIEPLLGGGK